MFKRRIDETVVGQRAEGRPPTVVDAPENANCAARLVVPEHLKLDLVENAS